MPVGCECATVRPCSMTCVNLHYQSGPGRNLLPLTHSCFVMCRYVDFLDATGEPCHAAVSAVANTIWNCFTNDCGVCSSAHMQHYLHDPIGSNHLVDPCNALTVMQARCFPWPTS